MADLNFATLSRDYAAITEATVKDFRGSLHGVSLLLGDEGYDSVRRIWNAMVDKRPALVSRCSGTADVIKSVNFARENDLLISVRGGGHNFPGNSVCDDGLMIDLSLMTGVRVNPAANTVRAQGGTKWGAFDHETQPSAAPRREVPTLTPASPVLRWEAASDGCPVTTASVATT